MNLSFLQRAVQAIAAMQNLPNVITLYCDNIVEIQPPIHNLHY